MLKLEGVDSIDDAETFRGIELRIGEDELDALPARLVLPPPAQGPDASRTPAGRPLGTVADILETGGEAPVLVVRGARRRDC